jgi:hypothetical protein
VADPDDEAAIAGLLALTKFNIPVDVQELLVRGDPQRGIPRGALSACLKATLEAYQKRQSE